MNNIRAELTALQKVREAELIVKIGFMKFTPPHLRTKCSQTLQEEFFFRDPSARGMTQTIEIPELV